MPLPPTQLLAFCGRKPKRLPIYGNNEIKNINYTQKSIKSKKGNMIFITGSLFCKVSQKNKVQAEETIKRKQVCNLEQRESSLACNGQLAKTVLAVGYTTSGKVQGISLDSGNVVNVYSNGEDFLNCVPLYTENMRRGEPICFTELPNGAIITSTKGFYGFSEQIDGNNESPMPLLLYGLAFKKTSFFGFRNFEQNNGLIRILNGPYTNTIRLTDGNGNVILGQSDITLTPWEYTTLSGNGNIEYILEGSELMMACLHAQMGAASPGFYDSRLIMPMTDDGIVYPRFGQLTAELGGTFSEYFVRDGAEGNFITSPGSVSDISTITGASDARYSPDGATRIFSNSGVSTFSGADNQGLEATPLMPTKKLSQVVAQPLRVTNVNNDAQSSIAIASPYRGTAEIYEWNFGTQSLNTTPSYTIEINRNIPPITTLADQNHPAAGQLTSQVFVGDASRVPLTSDLNPGLIISDVPILVITQSRDTNPNYQIRSQNSSTTNGIINQDDETLSFGITPDDIRAVFRIDPNDGLRYRLEVVGGIDTWVLA